MLGRRAIFCRRPAWTVILGLRTGHTPHSTGLLPRDLAASSEPLWTRMFAAPISPTRSGDRTPAAISKSQVTPEPIHCRSLWLALHPRQSSERAIACLPDRANGGEDSQAWTSIATSPASRTPCLVPLSTAASRTSRPGCRSTVRRSSAHRSGFIFRRPQRPQYG